MNKMPVRPGIGDKDDLLVKLHETTGNRWYPQIQSGTYFLNNKEAYLYASEGKETFTIAAGYNIVTLASNVNLEKVSKNGPLILLGREVGYVRCTSCFRTFKTVYPSGSDILLSITVPTNLVMLTDYRGKHLQSVPATGFLTAGDEYYYHDVENNLAYIMRSPSSSGRLNPLYATYLDDVQNLQQEEIVLVRNDGTLRVAFGNVLNTGAYAPSLVLPGSGTIGISAVNDNVITPATSLPVGRQVGVKYYVNHSFAVIPTSGALRLHVLSYPNDVCTLYWENAQLNSYHPLIDAPHAEERRIQLNPLYTGIKDGFLYAAPPIHPAENLARLRINCSPVKVSNAFQQVVKMTVYAVDSDNNLLPNIPITCTVTNSAGTFAAISLDTQPVTDQNGEMHFAYIPWQGQVGVHTVLASAITVAGSGLYATTSFMVDNPLIQTDLVCAGKAFLYLSPSKDANGKQDLFIYMSDQSGMPLLYADGVIVTCETGQLFSTEEQAKSIGSNTITLSTRVPSDVAGLRLLHCKYKGTGTDRIKAIPYNDEGGVTETFVSTALDVSNA